MPFYRHSIELPHSSHMLEKEYPSEDLARKEAVKIYEENDGLIRTIAVFMWAYDHHHAPEMLTVYDGQWSEEYGLPDDEE